MSAFNPYEEPDEWYCANCGGRLGSEPHDDDGELICGACHVIKVCAGEEGE